MKYKDLIWCISTCHLMDLGNYCLYVNLVWINFLNSKNHFTTIKTREILKHFDTDKVLGYFIF